jgi:hypothetical protein
VMHTCHFSNNLGHAQHNIQQKFVWGIPWSETQGWPLQPPSKSPAHTDWSPLAPTPQTFEYKWHFLV